MKRIRNIWPHLHSFENLLLAYRRARLGKSKRPDVALFSMNLERELLSLEHELNTGTYQPGEYRQFTIYERKLRLIAAAPFRDRVVHHAILNRIEPQLDRRFIFDSYACRKGKGVHAAVDRYQNWAKRYRYVLKLDVFQYFPCIDHQLLNNKLQRRIKDQRTLELLALIIEKSPQDYTKELAYFPGDDLFTPLEKRAGIPIGNLTSQFFANLYLNDLDHFIKEELRLPAYLRYVDDMVLLADDKAMLAEYRDVIREKLAKERLTLHPRKAHISKTSDGLNLFGYLVYPNRRRLRNDNGYRFIRRLKKFSKAYQTELVDWKTINSSVQSWVGHARHADTLQLRSEIFSDIVFCRGSDQ
ncbi:MAG: reverse transcriptase/maturase family protein [Gammaproteobacteria bacterium]|nr:reverse transcriptase/maturase family protein [Gammaproteobacteria bacterium]